jgi:uncharacterized protein YdeI (YjbR/CyaY-like superfamily)
MNKKTNNNSNSNFQIISFKNSKEWNKWLSKNHLNSNGIWIRFFKKDSGVSSVIHDEALDEALCYGWIDGQLKKYDDKSWLQKFTPRRAKSIWSKRNIDITEQLIKSGKMKPPGLKEIEAAKSDGRWEKAYDSLAKMQVPDDFLKKLSKDKKALKFFETLNKANKYALAWRLQTAKKPETRNSRMEKILEMLSKGEKFH